MSWFEKLMPSRIRVDAGKDKKVMPEGITYQIVKQ